MSEMVYSSQINIFCFHICITYVQVEALLGFQDPIPKYSGMNRPFASHVFSGFPARKCTLHACLHPQPHHRRTFLSCWRFSIFSTRPINPPHPSLAAQPKLKLHLSMERITADWLPDDAPWRKIKKDALIKKCARRKLPVDGSQSALQQRLLNYQQANITEVRQTSWRVNPSGPDETDYKRSGKQPLPIRGVYYVSNSRGGFTMVFIFGHPRPFGGFSNVPVYFNNKPTARVR